MSCFAFEGIFKICQYLFFGTNNIAQQIAANLKLKTFINRDCNTNDILNNNLKNFLKDMDKHQSLNENKILLSKYTTLDNLDLIEKNLIKSIASLNTVNIPYGTRAIINKIKFSTYSEDVQFKNQDYTVRYLKDKQIKYGLIRRFYQISNTIYAIVQCFSKKKNFVNDSIMEHELNKYFLICQLNDELEIINVNNIEKKCIILKHEEEFFISIANLLNEHD